MGKKTIQYGIDLETGLIISRYDKELAIPVLDYEHMKPENGFETCCYYLEKVCLNELIYMDIKWTRKIPILMKNEHRVFWGMKPIN